MTEKEIKQAIQSALKGFSSGALTDKATDLFKTLGYNTERQNPFTRKSYAYFKESFLDGATRFKEDKALVKEWKSVDLLFQLTKDEVSGQKSIFDTKKVDNTIIETYLFFAIELEKAEYTRTALAQITREINKVFPMPVMLIFKHGEHLTLSVINRRLHKKDEQKDVLEKVTLIKDISIQNPHRAHIEILFDLSLEELKRVHKFTNFVELHNAWQKTLDTKELNKRFYRDLSNWYFWAMQEVTFPGADMEADKFGMLQPEDKVREHNAKNLIRLLTRILFVWFIKEKNLIPDELFDESYVRDNLINGLEPRKKKNFDHKTQGSKYYRAILQNLFFATLNQTVGKREFRKDGQQMNVTNLMRYESYFKNPKAYIKLLENIVPFMNGGLFECLDSPDPVLKGKKGGDVIIYEDGFSDRKDNRLCVPDYIFFGTDEHADLSEELGDKKQKDVTVSGLIKILKSYKFTVTENTPIEEDIALDPELLGRVFENLLASYNPETKTTARKQTGSFYTPREIVNYMVDESLKAYLKQKLETDAGMKPEDAEIGLEFLVGYNEKEHLFDPRQTTVLINAIDTCKILDPACGSGAFPMGILHKLVHVLHKLDPNNKLWKERQIVKAKTIDDSDIRDNLIADIETAFTNNELDYGRKLYLIENCIYGVDIQPIATQISKLRFFISLIVDQKADKSKDNFGIRPLPNLETKFVAANTLIGIEKPKAQGSLFDNTKVLALEEKLKDVRHRLFSAKTPANKRKLREEDQKLREEMGTLLADAGWSNDTARQLAGWDPYNQNASSPFFDPKWMFGISNGFDVVIGNPPWITYTHGELGKYFTQYFKGKYSCAMGFKLNSFPMFVEESISLLKTSGIFTLIIPNRLLDTPSYKGTRDLILKRDILLLESLPSGGFEQVVAGNIILSVINREATQNQIISRNFYSREILKIHRGTVLAHSALQININRNPIASLLIDKINRTKSLQLSDLCFVHVGMMVRNRDTVFNNIRGRDKVVEGEDLGRYTLKKYKKFNLDDIEIFGGTKRESKHRAKPKLFVRKTGNVVICSLDEKGIFAEQSVYLVIPKNTNANICYLNAVLNSKIVTFYFQNELITNPEAYPYIQHYDLERIPLITNSSLENNVIDIVNNLLLIKADNTKADTTKLEAQIDKIFYKLYNLTDEEIAIVEGK